MDPGALPRLASMKSRFAGPDTERWSGLTQSLKWGKRLQRAPPHPKVLSLPPLFLTPALCPFTDPYSKTRDMGTKGRKLSLPFLCLLLQALVSLNKSFRRYQPTIRPLAGPLGTPLGLAQRKRASPRGEAGTSGRSPKRRGSLRCLPPLEVRPSSVAPDPAESRPQH